MLLESYVHTGNIEVNTTDHRFQYMFIHTGCRKPIKKDRTLLGMSAEANRVKFIDFFKSKIIR